jgi:molybdopterin-guanine dinucleotide biosynthesis protein A
VIGVVLAGAAGTRQLDGRPLASYPAAALAGVCERVAMVCGPDVPELPGTERWEGGSRRALGEIVHALETADSPVLVCAAELPFVTSDACRTLIGAAGSTPAVVAAADGVVHPTFGLYAPAALDPLRAAGPDASLVQAVEALDPVRVALPPALLRGADGS